MNGYVNKQNCRIWADTNPHQVHQKQLHPEKVTVWSRLWSDGIISPYIFENEDGSSVIKNGVRYKDMINNFLWTKLDGMDTNDMWFQ